jgi:hypothetical protein
MGIYHVIKNHSIVYLREMLSFGNTRRTSKKNTASRGGILVPWKIKLLMGPKINPWERNISI